VRGLRPTRACRRLTEKAPNPRSSTRSPHQGSRGNRPAATGRAARLLAGGDDDSSHDHSRDELRELIERRKAEGWQFLMLGPEFNVYAAARGFGIDDDAIISSAGGLGILHAMTATGDIAAAFALGRSVRVCFTDRQKRLARDWYAECNKDLKEITISDEEIERAMRVYTPEEAMGLLRCAAPWWSESTEAWRDFLAKMRAAPQTPATDRGIAEAERELAHRHSWRDYDGEILEPRRRRVRGLLRSFETTQAEAAARRSWGSEPGSRADDEPFGGDDGDAK